MTLSPVKLPLDSTNGTLREQLVDAGIRGPVVDAIVGTLTAKDLLNLDNEGWADEDCGAWTLINEKMADEDPLNTSDKFKVKRYILREKQKISDAAEETNPGPVILQDVSFSIARTFLIHVLGTAYISRVL